MVLDREEYVESIETEMEHSSSYEMTDNNRTEEAHKKVKKLVNKMNRDGLVSDDLKQYLTPRYVQKGKLKGNLKLHKANATYRTIVSGIGTPTEKLAELAEHELKDFLSSHLRTFGTLRILSLNSEGFMSHCQQNPFCSVLMWLSSFHRYQEKKAWRPVRKHYKHDPSHSSARQP